MSIPLDIFGLREGSLRSKAAALYAKGATSKEVIENVGSEQLGLLRELKLKGHKVKKKKILVGGHRVTQYTLMPKRS